ncbi:methyltransferase-domain-containing protein [Cokeromyces recurvatus]|uniref:methyltransferase-domain-containing protein n=1 Tax=Cokeromyces recurvatus TaxID=90255 RepID=UPI00221FBCFC|nr:methyltransferase-domain-containing protein [Cokeromyces recurvatus]KAI7906112.1 methyltransferase-domain-containing protein [Cokeromyces recurvatus]
MQPFFETSGWSLPTTIAPQKPKETNKKNQKVDNMKETIVTKEADQLQAQLVSLNNQATSKNKKNKTNKKRVLEQEQSKQQNKKAKKDAKQMTVKQPETSNKKTQQKKKLQEGSEKQNIEKVATKKAATLVKKSEDLDDGLTPLQRKMKEKLSGARFRWLNEQLYTTPGKQSFELFQEKPELFDEYHEGFRHQVESWPENPVDIFIEQLKKLPKNTVIADLGCGDAMIAQTLTKQKVLSFDLIAKNEYVTACDITKLPLKPNSVDVAVFSLSLMGTNYLDFLKEAYRVLKVGGELKIAEVVSRFTDLDAFISLLENLNFEFIDKDDNNKMFIMLYFTKQPKIEDELDNEILAGLSKTQKRALKKGAGINHSKSKLQKKAQQLLKPCLYKKR